MSDSVKVYAMTNNDDSELNILNAIVEAAGALYVDVPGLGLVEITTRAALAAVKKMNKESGSNRFALCKPSRGHGLCGNARILMNWY